MRMVVIICMAVEVAVCGTESKKYHLIVNTLNDTNGTSAIRLERIDIVNEASGYYLDLDQPILMRIWTVGSFSITLLIATISKYSVIRTMFDNGLWSKPIHILIFVDQVISFVSYGLRIVVIISVSITNTPMIKFTSEHFCTLFEVISVYGLSYYVIGSWAIATYRILYIRFNDFIKFKFGQWNLMWALLLSCVINNSIATYNVVYSQRKSSWQTELCYGRPAEQWHSVLSFYQNPTQPHDFSEGIAISVVLVFCIMEGIAYVFFFHFLYTHDKQMTKVLGLQEVNRRIKKNCITFSCEMYCFFIELIFFVILFLSGFDWFSVVLRQWIVRIRLYMFGVSSVIQTMSTESTRRKFFDLIVKIFPFFSWKLKNS